MSSIEAFGLCPDLEFVPAEQSKYIWTSEQIFNMLKSYGFEMEYASIDEFRMDILDEPAPFELAEKIRQQIKGAFNITASIGLAKNALLAKLASKLNKPNGVTLLTEENLTQVLAKTPAKKICGVGPKLNENLSLLGIQTCLDLYQKTPQFLEEFFGKNGLNLYLSLHSSESLSQGEREEKEKSVSHSYTLPRASKTPRFIHSWIRLLSEMVALRLRQKGLVAGTTHLWLNGPEIGNISVQRASREPTNDGFEI
jgi:DNA polymerase-4